MSLPTPTLRDADLTLYAGDCLEVMARMPAESVDAVVTDPPYGLAFMGRSWDRIPPGAGFAAFTEEWATAALRVMRPGAHLIAFGGTRTFHRLFSGLEDAGLEVRDTLLWLTGEGFPKSRDVSKDIDRAAGAEREVVGYRRGVAGDDLNDLVRGGPVRWSPEPGGGVGAYGVGARQVPVDVPITAPATPEAERWSGWGSALRPGWEPIALARKPLRLPTLAAQVLATGTGAINVDACRLPTAEDTRRPPALVGDTPAAFGRGAAMGGNGHPRGRWAPNVTMDAAAAAELDAQAGERVSPAPRVMRRGASTGRSIGSAEVYGSTSGLHESVVGYGDGGGVSRFFYVAKASTAERDGSRHPTVKPVDLMRWLCRLVTPPGGLILDPFAGSGSTLLAARAEGFRSVGIEMEADALADAAHRTRQLSLFGDPGDGAG